MRLTFAAVLFFALTLAVGCGGKDSKGKSAGKAPEGAASDDAHSPAALTVGGRDVPLTQFERTFWIWRSNRASIPADTSEIRKFVPTFVETQLIHRMALDSLPELTGMPKDNLDEIEERRMVECLRTRSFAEANKVDDRALKRAYDLLGKKMHVRYMAIESQTEADAAVRGLREGALFDKLAKQKSMDAETRENGGDLGWVVYTDLDAKVSEKLFALDAGQILGPVEAENKYQIFQVVEVAPNEARGTFEAERSKLELGIRSAALTRALGKFMDDLFAEYHVKIDPAEVAWMTVFLKRITTTAHRGVQFDAEGKPIGGYVQEAQVPWKGNPVSEADSGRVVATYDSETNGGRITPVRIVDKLIEKPSIGWPAFDDSKDTENLVKNLLLEELEVREAKRQGAQSWPEVVSHVAEKREEIRDRVFYRYHVRFKALVSEEKARAYYDTHKSAMSEPERRRFIGVNSANWDNAIKAGDLLRAGKSPEEIFDALAPSDSTIKITASKGTDPLAFGQSPLLDRFLFKLPKDGVSDPIPVGNTFTVAKVVEIIPARSRTFEEAKEEIQAKLGGALEDSVRAILLTDCRQKYPVEIHWDVVRQARLASS